MHINMGVAAQRTNKYSQEHAKMLSLSLVELRVLFILLLCAVQGHGQTVEIFDPPPPIIVPAGTNVTLQCRASGTGSVIILWQVNETQLAGEVTQTAFAMRGIFVGSMREEGGFTFSTITAHASLANNQTRFVCQRSEGVLSTPISSNSSEMTVFGLPAPPSQLSVSPEATAVLHLHWDEPFSQPRENISFTLHSTNLRTGTVVRVEEATETCITFRRPEGDDDCDRYNFTVLSENQVGLSEPSTAVTASFPSGPQSVEEIDISVTRNGSLFVNLSFNGSESCQDYPATSYNVTLNTSGRPPLLLGPFTLSGGAERITITTADGLLEDSVYSASVVVWNEYGTTSSEESTFYTTDVQNVSVEVNGDAVTIICTFLTGTNVQGCRIEFLVPMNPTPVLSIDIDRGNDSRRAQHVLSMVQQLPADNSYQVLVYDLKADGRVGSTALMATIDIIIPSVSPSTSTPASSAVSSLSPIATTNPTDTGTLNPTQGLSSGILSAIIGASVAVVVLLVLILITVIVIVTTCTMRQRKKVRERLRLERQNPNELLYNMAYEQCTPTGLKNGANLGASESQDHAYDIPKLAAAVPIASTAANPMYASTTPIHSGGSDSPRYAIQPIPVYEEVKLKDASVTNGIKVQQNISYGCLPEVTVDEQ